jgi:hypothetical protein
LSFFVLFLARIDDFNCNSTARRSGCSCGCSAEVHIL